MIVRTVALLLAAALVTMAAWQLAIGWHPSGETYPVQGVDVSEANGAIEWPSVAGAGADFGYAVATVGAGWRDRRFEANWQGIAEAGLPRGAIHRYSLCERAIDQANAFNTVVPRDKAALPAAVEIGYDAGCTARPERGVLLRDLAQFLTMVETHMGKPMLLLTTRAIERDYRLSEGLPRGSWVVGNLLKPGYATRPWRMWRASDIRRIEGVAGAVNWDVAAAGQAS